MASFGEPVTVFRCPCSRYIVTSNGLDDHLKSCPVLLDKVNSSVDSLEEDAPVINPEISSKPDVVVGNVFGVEIIEFRLPKVNIRRCIWKETYSQDPRDNLKDSGENLTLSVSRKGRLRKASRYLAETFKVQHSDSDNEEEPEASLSEEEDFNDDEFSLPSSSKKRKRNLNPVISVKSEYSEIPSGWPKVTRKRDRRKSKRPCPVCEKLYYQGYLQEHLVVKHLVRSDQPIPGEDFDKYVCPLCSSRIKSRNQLKMHFITHLENNPYVCKVAGCSYRGEAPCHLARHMRIHTGADLIPCPKCNVFFSRQDKIDQHTCIFDPKKLTRDQNGFLRSRRSKSMYSNIAGQKDILTEETIDNTRKSLKNNRVKINEIILTDPVYLKVIEKKPEFAKLIFPTESWGGSKPNPKEVPTKYAFRCDPCFTRFFDKQALATHKKMCEVKPNLDNGPGRLEKMGCPICGSSFENFKVLVDHVEGTHPTQLFKCGDCERLYSAQDILDRHSECHKKPFRCASCLRRYLTEPELIQHKKQCGGRKECSKCGKILVNILSWQRHWKLIHGTTVQYEDYPGYKSRLPNGSRKIRKKSTKCGTVRKIEFVNTFPFKCKPCGTLFYDKKALTIHHKICKGDQMEGKYGGERHGCPICGESFENFEAVLDHVQGCHPLKVFKCDECKRMYSKSQTLNYHLQKHVNKFRCSRCYRRFATFLELNDHKAKCRTDMKCSKCGKVLINSRTWRNHWKLVHRKSPPFEDYDEYEGYGDDIQETTEKNNSDIWTGKSERDVKKEPAEPVCYVEAGEDTEFGLELPVDNIVDSQELKTIVKTDLKLEKEDEGEFILS